MTGPGEAGPGADGQDRRDAAGQSDAALWATLGPLLAPLLATLDTLTERVRELESQSAGVRAAVAAAGADAAGAAEAAADAAEAAADSAARAQSGSAGRGGASPAARPIGGGTHARAELGLGPAVTWFDEDSTDPEMQADVAARREGLEAFAAWLVARYPAVHPVLPNCWPQHSALVEELTALWCAHLHAYRADASLAEALTWHERLWAAKDRWPFYNTTDCREDVHREPLIDVLSRPHPGYEWTIPGDITSGQRRITSSVPSPDSSSDGRPYVVPPSQHNAAGEAAFPSAPLPSLDEVTRPDQPAGPPAGPKPGAAAGQAGQAGSAAERAAGRWGRRPGRG